MTIKILDHVGTNPSVIASAGNEASAKIISFKQAKLARQIAKFAYDQFKEQGFIINNMSELVAALANIPPSEDSGGYKLDWDELPEGHDELIRVEIARRLDATNLFLPEVIEPYVGNEFVPRGTIKVEDYPATVAVGALVALEDESEGLLSHFRVYIYIFPEQGAILDVSDWVNIARCLLGMKTDYFCTSVGLSDEHVLLQTTIYELSNPLVKKFVDAIVNIKLPMTPFENNPFL